MTLEMQPKIRIVIVISAGVDCEGMFPAPSDLDSGVHVKQCLITAGELGRERKREGKVPEQRGGRGLQTGKDV